MCRHFAVNTPNKVNLEKPVLGVHISDHSVCRSGIRTRKLKGIKIRNGVRAAVQVGFEDSKRAARNLKGLERKFEFDVVSERDLREKGFLGMTKTKLVCTIGPACCSSEDLEKMAMAGMNVARLNMCHNTSEWHRDLIRKIKKLNRENGFCISIMIDTEGSQIHVVDHGAPSSVKAEVF